MPKGIKGFQKGYKKTKEQIEKHKLAVTGRKKTEEDLKNVYRGGFKKKHTEESKKKMSLARMGKKAWNKSGGTKTVESKKLKSSKEYRIFRTACFERDDYTCIWCFKKGGVLNMDHIKPFALFPELRMALDNVRTLCHDCHKKTDTYGWKFYHNKEKIYG